MKVPLLSLLLQNNSNPEGHAGAMLLRKMLVLMGKMIFVDALMFDFSEVDALVIIALAGWAKNSAIILTNSLLASPRCLCIISVTVDSAHRCTVIPPKI